MSPLEWEWIQAQFKALHAEHKTILDKIQSTHISPELEKQINKARTLSVSIDHKVPDRNE